MNSANPRSGLVISNLVVNVLLSTVAASETVAVATGGVIGTDTDSRPSRFDDDCVVAAPGVCLAMVVGENFRCGQAKELFSGLA
ncbi:hypothetical protein BJP34_23705 [Moorena producens PAL-8-15-08-1]|uniref:Uncharacterized protein n=1 Tax=Moorena producens PAL-8-15-08-1 TaxID=1458985 RepID=A0A1D8TWL5_9CYAN|nr:hypothetical protein BJP34_23705 [Moorena producens PAL-8-15-08-1]